MNKLKPEQLRHALPTESDLAELRKTLIPIYLVLDSVLDTYNIGSLFRLADAIGAKAIYLCGQSSTPPSSRIHKAAVGTENWVAWEYKESVIEAIDELKKIGCTIVSVEQNKNSISYSDLSVKLPVAIVVGHETSGVSEEAIKKSDITVELPMNGINTSLNVWGAAAVVCYKILEKLGAE